MHLYVQYNKMLYQVSNEGIIKDNEIHVWKKYVLNIHGTVKMLIFANKIKCLIHVLYSRCNSGREFLLQLDNPTTIKISTFLSLVFSPRQLLIRSTDSQRGYIAENLRKCILDCGLTVGLNPQFNMVDNS